MLDKVYNAFLERQFQEGSALVQASDLVNLSRSEDPRRRTMSFSFGARALSATGTVKLSRPTILNSACGLARSICGEWIRLSS